MAVLLMTTGEEAGDRPTTEFATPQNGGLHMPMLGRLFGSERKTAPARHPTIMELLSVRAPPWDCVSSEFIGLVVDVLGDKGLVDTFVWRSMEHELLARWAVISKRDVHCSAPEVIRAQISQILCETGNRSLPAFTKALASGQRDKSVEAVKLCIDCFETAIAFERSQIAAYIELAQIYATYGDAGIREYRDKSREYAKMGLLILAEMRDDPGSRALARGESSVIPPYIFDQAERQLRRLAA
jgi:hypothetical protein